MDANELKAAFTNLAPLPDGDSFWTLRRAELRARMASDDPSEFLTWSTIISTMFVGDAPYIRDEWDALLESGEWERWKQAIAEDDVGRPARLPDVDWTSGNLIHQAYHLLRWEQHTGQRITSLKSIVEIGGGYGAMAKVARRAGFGGKYLIVDTPEFSLLQKYYLSQCGVEADCRTQIVGRRSPGLLIALWSLSEIDIAQSDVYLDSIKPSGVLASANSVEIAIDLASRLKTNQIEIDHLPGNFYLLQ